jgi:hypothetical protein
MKRLYLNGARPSASTSIARLAFAAAATLMTAAFTAGSQSRALAADAKRLNVLELFTSQGCSSCPPADKLLAELAKRDNVLALSFPVNYWDSLGWKDTLAKDAYNARQRAYAEARGDREIYTPQLVINGVAHAVGSVRPSIEAAIASSTKALRDSFVPVSLSYGDNTVRIETGSAPANSAMRSGKLWLAFYSKAVSVDIGRGENSGREVTYTNVVRSLTIAGNWNGAPARYAVEIPNGISFDSCAALLQADKSDAILGAANLPVRSE